MLLLCQYANQHDHILWAPQSAAWWTILALIAATACLSGLVEMAIQRPVGKRLSALLVKRPRPPLLRPEPPQGQDEARAGEPDHPGRELIVRLPSEGAHANV